MLDVSEEKLMFCPWWSLGVWLGAHMTRLHMAISKGENAEDLKGV